MNRKDFFKKACLYGICGCTGISFFSASSAMASVENTDLDDKPDWRIGFMQTRFAKLIDIMGATVDEKTRLLMLENLGRECAAQGEGQLAKYKGDMDAYLKMVEEKWADKATYDAEKKEYKIVGKKTVNCFCPFVDKSKISKVFCNCSLGWQKGTFEALLGEKVEAKVESSILYGGDRCSFSIRVL